MPIRKHSLPDDLPDNLPDDLLAQLVEDSELPSPEEQPMATETNAGVKVPKKRGPKKKKMTRARVVKLRVRRVKANTRERNRMHGLNDALEVLREHVPCLSHTQKLSKIETLRLAGNYISALSAILKSGVKPDSVSFAKALSCGLSQNTMNLVAGGLELNPRTLMPEADPTGYGYPSGYGEQQPAYGIPYGDVYGTDSYAGYYNQGDYVNSPHPPMEGLHNRVMQTSPAAQHMSAQHIALYSSPPQQQSAFASSSPLQAAVSSPEAAFPMGSMTSSRYRHIRSPGGVPAPSGYVTDTGYVTSVDVACSFPHGTVSPMNSVSPMNDSGVDGLLDDFEAFDTDSILATDEYSYLQTSHAAYV